MRSGQGDRQTGSNPVVPERSHYRQLRGVHPRSYAHHTPLLNVFQPLVLVKFQIHRALRIVPGTPDQTPVMNFAKSADLRKRMYLAYNQRAYPKNVAVLKSLLEARQELAATLGYKTFADLAMADQMMGSASNTAAFLKEVDDASRVVAEKEYKLLLDYAQTQEPGLKSIPNSDANYWPEQYRRAKYDFDAQSVRPYQYRHCFDSASTAIRQGDIDHRRFRPSPSHKHAEEPSPPKNLCLTCSHWAIFKSSKKAYGGRFVMTEQHLIDSQLPNPLPVIRNGKETGTFFVKPNTWS
jgi:hypothetical protein